jgi:hypothetical protein
MRAIACIGATLTLLTAACATSQPSMLPPGLSVGYVDQDYWQGFGEPSLWQAGDIEGHESRLRLLLGAPHHRSNNRAVIRIDRDADGRAVGRFVRGERRSRYEWVITEERRFSVSQAELEQLDALIAQSRLWMMYPEYWAPAGDDFCTHQIEMLIERVNAEGYGVSIASTCAVPQDYLAVARLMIDIADAENLWIN